MNRKQEWEKENYFKTLARFPKCEESAIRQAAEQAGKSLNNFIIDAVLLSVKRGVAN